MVTIVVLAGAARADRCESYGLPTERVVEDAPVREASGLAASRIRPGVLFTHDDAGGDPLLFAVHRDGSYVGSHVVRGASLVDWEDLSPGPCPRDGGSCLYVGDIGDNEAARDAITIYVVEEPEEGRDARVQETWDAVYPDGPQDAETLLVHPCTGDVYVVTKRDDATGAVYRMPADRRGTVTLEVVTSVVLDDERSITGGQWDANGDRLVLRTRDHLWEWRTGAGDPEGHWSEPPARVGEVDEERGEGVAYTLDGAIVTSDEGQPLVLHELDCRGIVSSEATCAYEPTGRCGCDGVASCPVPLALLVAALSSRRRR